jgi:hypothetical protein
MAFFCLLWVPLFYLFRRSVLGGGVSGGVWALLLGSITAVIQFFLGYHISPGGFGASRWLFGLVDIVSLPILIPAVVYTLILALRGFSSDIDYPNFILLWLIPVAALRAIAWSSTRDPMLLVAVPLLWTALAGGIPYFINLMLNNLRWYTAALSLFGILFMPVLAATVYWAFFSQHTVIGFFLFAAVNVPLVFSLIFDFTRA